MNVSWRIYDADAADWPAQVDRLWTRARGEPLLPDYFVKTTFVKLGGRLLELLVDAGSAAIGLLFPRDLVAGRRIFTLRLHAFGPLPDDAQLISALTPLIAPDMVHIYRPAEGRSFAGSHLPIGDFDLGAPAADELPAIKALHAAIWGGGDEARYPNDLHSAEFGPGTSLVARKHGTLAGFLFGFVRFGGPADLAAAGVATAIGIESQVMGIAPEFRRFGLAATLKRAQARAALARGIGLIRWTADPLQFANATLNFAKLRAVCGQIYPDYYPFRNALNRVPASRLALTWLPDSLYGRQGMLDVPAARELSRYREVAILNDGPHRLTVRAGAPQIALEIPADWTTLQHEHEALAAAWRRTSDGLLVEHLGFAPGRTCSAM